MKSDVEKITDGIIFIGTLCMVFMIGFTLLSAFFLEWKTNLIVLTILYILYRWLGIVLTGIIFFSAILVYILLPILLVQEYLSV